MIDLFKSGHILYISSIDISIGNGPGVNEREFILALHKSIDNRAHFIIPRPDEEVPDLPLNVCSFSSPHRQHAIKHFPSHVLSTMRLANQLILNHHFDLLVFRLDLMPFAPLYITNKYPVPFALKTLGQGQMKVFYEKIDWPIGSILARINQFLVNRMAKNSIAIDTVSNLQLKYLNQTLNLEHDRVFCIDNAVNTDRFHPTSTLSARRELGLEQFNPIVGFTGNHANERGGNQLINIVPKLVSKYPNLGVVILGDISGNLPLIELARNLGIEEHSVFPGYVPFQKVPTYVNALDVGISLLPPKYYGQSELKVRQYLACGKPVIATTPGSNDFLSRENLGSLVQYSDINTIVKELDKWLSLPEDDRSKLSTRAFQYAIEYLSVEQSVAKRIALWNERLT